MAHIARIAHRTFLVGTGTVAAGLAVGTCLYQRDPANPLQNDLPKGATTLNPCVRIDAGGIRLIKGIEMTDWR